MQKETVNQSLRALVFSAALIFAGVPAFAGKVMISGQDADDSGHVSQAFGAQMLDFLASGNTNGGTGILILGGYTGTSASTINSWNALATESLTAASGAGAISSATFGTFAGILMPSASTQTAGGMTQAELNAINARATDIANFVNSGGNLLAFTEQGLTGAFGWFPLGALLTTPISTSNVSQTPALAAAGFTATNAEISGDLYHNEFDGPAGFFGLSVLAINNNTGDAVILGGGTTTQITVPEPGLLGLIGFGLAAVGFVRRRRTAQA